MENFTIRVRTGAQLRKKKFRKNFFEVDSWEENKLTCGVDEVGRGCLAGPIVTAAVVLFQGKISRLLKDSKLLTLPERLKAYRWITKRCWYSYSVLNHRAIDKINIYQATLACMRRSVIQLIPTKCPYPLKSIVVDAMPLNLAGTVYSDIPVHYFPFGEKKSSSIAAASIIAKVTRDELVKKLSLSFPQYKLAQHKGYSTKLHKEMIRTHRSSIIHRKTFLKKVVSNDENNDTKQQSIF